MKKAKKYIGLGAVIYAVLIVLLVQAERTSLDANITTIGEAIWYSLITVTTVGYGDLYPVTLIGKALSLMFVFFSVGLSAFIIAMVLWRLSSKRFISLRLAGDKGKTWYVFTRHNEMSWALASDIAGHHPQDVFIFLNSDSKESLPQGKTLHLDTDIATLEKVKGSADNLNVFYIKANQLDNYSEMASTATQCKKYCMADMEQDSQCTMFDTVDCTSRLYWQKYPVKQGEKCIVMIGHSQLADLILERGMTNNVFQPGRNIEYHTFGDFTDFANNHTQLHADFNVGLVADNGKDSVVFHTDSWNGDSKLLKKADRIVLRGDEADNLALLHQLQKYFNINGKVHIYSTVAMQGVATFGDVASVFTEELVINQKMNQLAINMNELYRQSVNGNAATWEQLTPFLKSSNIAAAEHLKIKLDILKSMCGEMSPIEYYTQDAQNNPDFYRELEHRRWVRFHIMNNWQYAPVRNNAERQHHLIVPYDQLTLKDQASDDNAWELLKTFEKEL